MIKKIIIVGEGGQGVKFMSNLFSNILIKLGYKVSLVLMYDSNVRGGIIESRIIVSNKKIKNPIFTKADYLIKLSKPKENSNFEAEVVIYENKTLRDETKDNYKKKMNIPFKEISSKLFNTKKQANMIALGKLLNCLGIFKNEKEIFEKDVLPIKLSEDQIKAIEYGFTYREDAQ